jgi:branched-chain amino acid transport system ATP-binding protein
MGAESGLTIENLTVRYGEATAVAGLTLSVGRGESIAILGANGAGKTTTLKAISRLVPWSAGDIRVDGRSLGGLHAYQVAALGVGHVPEGRRPFPHMSVQENLEVAVTRLDRATRSRRIQDVWDLLPRLAERRKQKAGTLSGGEQQMLALGRAMVRQPSILLLDEPSLGLSPVMTEHIYDALREVLNSGVSLVLVEQNAQVALDLVEVGYTLRLGRVEHQGTSEELRAAGVLRTAYLGDDAQPASADAAAGPGELAERALPRRYDYLWRRQS